MGKIGLTDLREWQISKDFLALYCQVIGRNWIKWEVQIAILVHIMYMTRKTSVITVKSIWMRMIWCV